MADHACEHRRLRRCSGSRPKSQPRNQAAEQPRGRRAPLLVAHTPVVRLLVLLPVIAVAVLVQPTHKAHSGDHTTASNELATCVRNKQASSPRLTYLEGVVRCVRLARMEATTVVRWSTCTGGGAYDGDYACETGSARISIRSTRAPLEFPPPPTGWPRSARRWHLYGVGTASCTRVSHGLNAGGPDTARSVSGRINHVDFAVLWPSIPADGTLALGVSPLWSNPLPETLKDAIGQPRPCRPSFALESGFLPPTRPGLSVADLLATHGVTARVRKQFLVGLNAPVPAWIGPLVARPLVVNVDTRMSASFVAST